MYYDLWWDSGSNQVSWESYNNQLTEVQGSTVIYATINGLSSGIEYNFKYRSQNIHGWSLGFSPSILMKTLTVPVKVTGVTTTINSAFARISWSEPYSGGVGIEVLSYLIEIQTKTGDFVEDDQCQGSDTIIIDDKYCEILVSTLTEEPYNLVIGDLIVARVQATNVKGANEYSDLNTEGAHVESIP